MSMVKITKMKTNETKKRNNREWKTSHVLNRGRQNILQWIITSQFLDWERRQSHAFLISCDLWHQQYVLTHRMLLNDLCALRHLRPHLHCGLNGRELCGSCQPNAVPRNLRKNNIKLYAHFNWTPSSITRRNFYTKKNSFRSFSSDS